MSDSDLSDSRSESAPRKTEPIRVCSPLKRAFREALRQRVRVVVGWSGSTVLVALRPVSLRNQIEIGPAGLPVTGPRLLRAEPRRPAVRADSDI